MKRRILAILLTLCLMVSLIPTALAEGQTVGQVTASDAAAESDGNRVGYRDLNHDKDDVIAEGLRNRETSFVDDKYDLWSSTYQRTINYVLLTTPQLAGSIGVTSVYMTYLLSTGQLKDIVVTYADAVAYAERIAEVRDEVDALIPAGADDVEIAHILHDYVITNYAYNTDFLKAYTAGDKDVDYSNYYASGVFMNHFAVCRGVSEAYKYLLDLYGIENAIAESAALDHVWNLVKIDGEWYHVDLSADNPTYDILGEVSHEYFLISTETMIERNPKRADFKVAIDDLSIVWTDDAFATSKKYESGQPWSDSHTSCYYHNGSLYTMSSDSRLLKDGEFFYQPAEHMSWHPYGNSSAQYTGKVVTAKLSPAGDFVYINSPRQIYRVNLATGEAESVYAIPAEIQDGSGSYTNPDQIFGLARIEGVLYCSIEQDTPKSNETWTTVPEEETGIGFGTTGNVTQSKSFTAEAGKSISAHVAGVPVNATVSVTSSNESVAAGALNGGTFTIQCLKAGTAVITITVNDTVLTANVTVTEPAADPMGFVSGAEILDRVTLSTDMGKSVTAVISGIPAGANSVVKSSDESVAAAALNGNALTITGKMDGSATITVTINETVLTAVVTVKPIYTKRQNVNLTVGESVTYTDQTGTYENSYTGLLLDSAIAAVKVKNVEEAGTPAKSASVTKLTSFQTGKYILGAGGTYLLKSGSSLTTTTDPESATVWTISGSSGSLTIKADGYYLCHSTSGISLSTSTTNAGWQFSGGSFLFKTSTRMWFWTTTTTYYLVNSNGFTVNTSASNAVAAYTVTPGSPAVPGAAYTETTITGVAAGETCAIVGSTLYAIKVTAPVAMQTITIHSTDDQGVRVAADTSISGPIGSAYTITPTTIAGYITPDPVSGVYIEGKDSVTLVYVLNTDKTTLGYELTHVTEQGDYTDESYKIYTDAIQDGQQVYDNDRATQSEADNAVKAIQSAKKSLKEVTKGYVLDTDGVNSGSEYLLVNGTHALAVVNGKLTTVSLTVSDNAVSQADANAVWVIQSSGSGYTLQNKASGLYLTYSTSGRVFNRKRTPAVGSSATVWNCSQSGNNVRWSVNSNWSTYYLNVGSSVSLSTGSANTTIYRKNS